MVGKGRVNLGSLTMNDLTGVINLYPWYGAARKELCQRMSETGGSDWGIKEYSDAALYLHSREMVSDIIRASRKEDYSDRNVESLLKILIAPESLSNEQGRESSETVSSVAPPYKRTVRSAGGDFFSQDEYDDVKTAEDNMFSGFVAERSDEAGDKNWEDPELGFCTETLAQIYSEQGYFVEAKKIYSRLILRYPEKSAYFASLIEKLETE